MESDIEDEGRAILVLESCLLSVFSGDFALAALIIPQVHAAAYLELDSGHTAYTAAVTHGPNGGTGSGGATTSCMRTSTAANGNTSANTVPQKHGRNPDDSEEYDKPPGNRKTKRIKATSGNRPRTFACHFHKKDPEKYGPWIHQKYLPCIAPCVPALHRIKFVP